MFKFVDVKFPELNFNSCLINIYPDKSVGIPDHSDDETSIARDSFILTISLGCTREMFFKVKSSGETLASLNLCHGDIILFSKNSQNWYTHGIPPSRPLVFSTENYLPRVSATFRCII